MKWAFLGLLTTAVLTMWIETRFAWSVIEVGLCVLAAWTIVAKRQIHMDAITALLGAAAAIPAVQLATGTTLSKAAAGNAALVWFALFLAFTLARHIATTDRDWVLAVFSVAGMMVATEAALQLFSSGGKIFWVFPSGYADSVMGPFVNRNQYAAWIELLLPVSLCLAATRPKYRFLHAASAAIMFTSVIASGSRAGFVLVSAEVVAVAAMLAGRLGWPKAIGAGGAILMALLITGASIGGGQPLVERFRSGGSEKLRADAVRASLHMVADHPWAGTGMGTWAMVYPRYAAFDTGLVMNQAHNDWLQWAAEGGLPFLAALIFFSVLLWKRAFQSIYGIGTVAVSLHALVDYPMQQRPALAAWFFAMAGLTMSYRRAVAGDHGLLRGVRARTFGNRAGDSPGLPEPSADPSPRPLPGRGIAPAGRTADEAVEPNAGDSGQSRRAAGL